MLEQLKEIVVAAGEHGEFVTIRRRSLDDKFELAVQPEKQPTDGSVTFISTWSIADSLEEAVGFAHEGLPIYREKIEEWKASRSRGEPTRIVIEPEDL